MKKLNILPLVLLFASCTTAQITQLQPWEFEDDVTIKGNLILEQDIDLTGNIDVDGTLTTDGLTNDGTSTLNGPVTVNGGNVTIQTGAWNDDHIVMGTYHIWNNAGELRIKNGAPTSAGDGAAIGGGGGGGDMLQATYDAAAVAEQLLGVTAAQSPSNKNFGNTNIWNGGAITLPTTLSTIAGRISWVSDEVRVGDGSSGLTLADLTSAQTMADKTFTNTNAWQGGNIEMKAVASAPALGDTHGTNWIVQKTDGAILWTGNGVSLASGVKRFSSDTEGANIYNKIFDTTNTWNQGYVRLRNEATPTLANEGNIGYNTTVDQIQYRDGAGVKTVASTTGSQSMSEKTFTNINGITIKDGFSYSFASGGNLSWFNGTPWTTAGTGLVAGTQFGNAFYGDAQGHIVNLIRGDDPTDGFWVIKDTGNDGTYDETLMQLNDVDFKYLGDTVITENAPQELSNKTFADLVLPDDFPSPVEAGSIRYNDTAHSFEVHNYYSVNSPAGIGGPFPSPSGNGNRLELVTTDYSQDVWNKVLYGGSRESGDINGGNRTGGLVYDTGITLQKYDESGGAPSYAYDEGRFYYDTLNDYAWLGIGGGQRGRILTNLSEITADKVYNNFGAPPADTGAHLYYDLGGSKFYIYDLGGTARLYSHDTQTASLQNKTFLDDISFNPGSDTDMNLFTVAVTGSPGLDWDEVENGFTVRASEFRTRANVLGVEDSAGSVDLGVIDSAGNFRHRTSGGTEQFRVESGSGHGVSVYNMPFQMRSSNISGTKLFELSPAGAVNINTTTGIDFNPGSDTDIDLLTVAVTGTPTLSWDESADLFVMNQGLHLDQNSGFALIVDGAVGDDWGVLSTGQVYSEFQAITLGSSVTTFQVTANRATVASPTANTIATITGGVEGQLLYLIFTNSNVTITDTNGHTANTVDLSAAFTSADDRVLTLLYDGTSWYEVSRSSN